MYEEVNLFKQTVLPDLRHNIKCGNSIIGNDYSLLPMERLEVKAFEWRDEFPTIMATEGFDAVIGNPPWGAEFTESELAYHRQNNREIIVRMINSFMYFVYQGCKKLRSNGFFGIILPDVILYQQDNLKLREFILKNLKLQTILNMGNVFEQVTRPSSILIAERIVGNHDTISIADFSGINKTEKPNAIIDYSRYDHIYQNDILALPGMLFITSNPVIYNIWAKVNSVPHKLLGDLVDNDANPKRGKPRFKTSISNR